MDLNKKFDQLHVLAEARGTKGPACWLYYFLMAETRGTRDGFKR